MFGFRPEYGISLEDAIGQIREDYRDTVSAAIEAAIDNETSYDIEYPIIGHGDGKLRWVRATGKLYPGEHGTKPHFSGVVTEITDRKLDERRKYDFIAIVSHELKTPLTSAKAYVQMLLTGRRKVSEDFHHRALQKVAAQIEKMHALIKGFLDVARLESSAIILEKQLFSINDLIEETVEELEVFADRHKIIVESSASGAVHADRQKIGQVISNLLANAIKYSPHGGVVLITCIEQAGYTWIYVKDHGIGIDTWDMDRIFDRFYRVENKHTTVISGFGIGLYLCAEIVRLHDGLIGLESEIGKGSTFYFRLPRR